MEGGFGSVAVEVVCLRMMKIPVQLGHLRARTTWAAAVLVAFLIARPLFAADLTGTWDLSYYVGLERQVITLSIEHDGGALSGEGILSPGGTSEWHHVELREGTVSGRDFRFILVRTDTDGVPSQSFSASWYHDEMSGRTDGAFGSRVFTGARRRVRR